MKFLNRSLVFSVLLLLIGWANDSQAQTTETRPFDAFLNLIEIEIDRSPEDPGPKRLTELIESECQEDYNCRAASYRLAVDRLMGRNHFFAAIPLAEDWQVMAARREDVAEQIAAYEKLAALYNYAGRAREHRDIQVELIRLYEREGEVEKLLTTEVYMAESLAWYDHRVEEAIAQVLQIRDKALELELEAAADAMLLRLKYLYEEHGYWHELEELVPQIEEIAKRENNPYSAYGFHAISGRADLLREAAEYDAAADKYQEAIHYVRNRPDKTYDAWSDIYLLHHWAVSEWNRGDAHTTETLLDTAYALGVKYDLHDAVLYSINMRLKIAESQGRYRDALEFERARQQRQSIMDSIAAGFNLRNYELELGLQQLTSERKRQALTLQLRNNQLSNASLIAGLIALMCFLLAWGYRRQKKARDILAKNNQLISEQAEKLRLLDEAKSRFFANASHELRTPLSLIVGPLKKLRTYRQLDYQHRSLLDLALGGSRDLRRLVNDILDLGKLDAGKLDLNLHPVLLAEFITSCFNRFEAVATQGRKISFDFKVAVPDTTRVEIDEEKCRRIIYNLLSNAFKFTPTGGKVSAFAEINSDNRLKIVVSDTGKGISPGDLPYIFDRYFQTNEKQAVAAGGTGIGLAICREYAQLMGGHISAESTTGKGSTLTVFLQAKRIVATTVPIKAGAEYARFESFLPVNGAQKKQPTSIAKSTDHNILIVEDHVGLRRYLEAVLSSRYSVSTAENGAEALVRLEDTTQPIIHLVISDLMMPVMDGYELLETLKEKNSTRHLPVIMLTARAGLEDKLRALRIGVDDYLTKPFEEDELLARIENLLANFAARTSDSGFGRPVEAPIITIADREWLEGFENFVSERLGHSDLSVSQMAATFAMSESTLLRQLKRLTGLTPKKYLVEVRLHRARELLIKRRYNSIGRVAAEVGYGDLKSFGRAYRKRFGLLPSETVTL